MFARSVAERDGSGKGERGGRPRYIEFNAHCYQRREDATQPHCLAGLVTAGDIINRLRAPTSSIPLPHAGRGRETGESLRTRTREDEREE